MYEFSSNPHNILDSANSVGLSTTYAKLGNRSSSVKANDSTAYTSRVTFSLACATEPDTISSSFARLICAVNANCKHNPK